MSYNNPYDKEDGILGTIVKGTALTGAGVVAVNAYRNPEATRRKFGQAMDMIAPIKSPKLNPYQQRLARANEILFSTVAERDARIKSKDKIRAAEAMQMTGSKSSWSAITPVALPIGADSKQKVLNEISAQVSEYSFEKLDDIRDIDNRPIGNKIHKQLKKKFPGQITNAPKFKGTRATWRIGGEDLEIDFSKRIGQTEGFMKRIGESMYVAPWRADLQSVDGKLGYQLSDPNTDILSFLSDMNDENGNGRLFWGVNENSEVRSKFEKLTGSGMDSKRAMAKLRSEAEKYSLRELDVVRNLQEAIKRETRTDTQIADNDIIGRNMHASKVQVNEHSAYLVGQMPAHRGVGSRALGTGAINSDVIDGKNVQELYDIHTNSTMDNNLITISTSGNTSKRIREMAIKHGGYVDSQSTVAELGWSMRVGSTAAYAEREKSFKGIMFESHKLAKTPFSGVGGTKIDSDALARIRHNFFINDDGADSDFKYSSHVQSKAIVQKNKGVYNMALALSPFESEAIMIGDATSENMKTLAPKTTSVAAMAIKKGDKAYEKSFVEMKYFDVDSNSQKSFTNLTLQDIMEDSHKSNIMTQGFGEIHIKRGTILGKKPVGQELLNDGTVNDIIARESGIIKTQVNRLIGRDDYISTLASHNRMIVDGHKLAGGVKIVSQVHEDAVKMALSNVTTRNTTNFRDNELVNELTQNAGLGKAEGTMSLDFLKKTLPKKGPNNRVVLGKGSSELMQVLQSAIGWQALQGDHDVKLKGKAAQQFSKYINNGNTHLINGELNLSKIMKKGNLSFKQMIHDKKLFADQYEHTIETLGLIREGFGNGDAQTIIQPMRGSVDIGFSSKGAKSAATTIDTHIRQLEILGERAKSGTNARKLLAKQITIGEIAKTVTANARELAMGVIGGVMPQEQAWNSIGKEFSEMKLSSKAIFNFLDNPEILRDLGVNSTTPAIKMSNELRLMESGARGHNINGALKAYGDSFGHIPHLKDPGDILKMLGGVNAYDDITLKRPEVALNTFLNSGHSFEDSKGNIINNRHGFTIEADGKKLYIPSGDVWSGYVTEDGSTTFDSMFLKTQKMLRGLTVRDGEPGDIEGWTKSLFGELGNSKEGLRGQATLKVDGSSYVKVAQDYRLLQNDVLGGAIDSWDTDASSKEIRYAASELKHLLGNSSAMSADDFDSQIKQMLSETFEQSQDNSTLKRSMNEILVAQYGEGHFLAKYESKINSIKAKEDIIPLVEKITSDQVKLSDKIADMYEEFGKTGNASLYNDIMSESRNMHQSYSIRYPHILQGSHSQTPTFISKAIRRGTVALGNIDLVNKNGDHDGDANFVKGIYSRATRNKTFEMIDVQQREAFKHMSLRIQGVMADIFQGGVDAKGPALAASIDGASSVAETILKTNPMATSVASFMTKAVTGGFNVGALQTKGYLGMIQESLGLSEDHIASMNSYFSNMISMTTEQKIIGSKQMETVIGDFQGLPDENKMKGILGMLNQDDYMEKSLQDIRSTGKVNPLIGTWASDAARHNNPKEIREVAQAVLNFADMENGWQEFGEADFRSTMNIIGHKEDVIDTMWDQYIETMAVERQNLASNSEAMRAAGLQDKQLFEIWGDALRSKDLSASENISFILSKKNSPGEALAALDLNRQMSIAGNMLNLPEMSNTLPQKGRRIIGYDKLQDGISWMMDPVHGGGPVRMAGVAGIGLVSMTALNVLSGDGTLEDPGDLPSVNNPSFTSNRGSGNMSMSTLSSNVGLNSNINLLTDNTMSPTSAIGMMQGMLGYQGNTISVRHDGEDPYKQDLMYYK